MDRIDNKKILLFMGIVCVFCVNNAIPAYAYDYLYNHLIIKNKNHPFKVLDKKDNAHLSLIAEGLSAKDLQAQNDSLRDTIKAQNEVIKSYDDQRYIINKLMQENEMLRAKVQSGEFLYEKSNALLSRLQTENDALKKFIDEAGHSKNDPQTSQDASQDEFKSLSEENKSLRQKLSVCTLDHKNQIDFKVKPVESESADTQGKEQTNDSKSDDLLKAEVAVPENISVERVEAANE